MWAEGGDFHDGSCLNIGQCAGLDVDLAEVYLQGYVSLDDMHYPVFADSVGLPLEDGFSDLLVGTYEGVQNQSIADAYLPMSVGDDNPAVYVLYCLHCS